MITAEELTKVFGSIKAVDNLSLTIERGKIVSLLGPNGAGKTTTLRLLLGLLTPTAGNVFIDGYNVFSHTARIRKIIGLLPEKPCLYERLTVYENLNFYAQLYDVPSNEIDLRIKDLLSFFNLNGKTFKKADTLSKGMKQKVALARALTHNPKILFLDEPTAGLDPKSAMEFRNYISKLCRKEKVTILLSTHNLAEATNLSDEILIICKGRLRASCTPRDLREASPFITISLAEEPTSVLLAGIKSLNFIKNIKINNSELFISVADEKKEVPLIIKKIVQHGGRILSVARKPKSLESFYLEKISEDE